MFDLKSSSSVIAAKLGCAMTIFVMLSACSSTPVPSDGALIPPAITNVTPEPESLVADSSKAVHSRSHKARARNAHQFAQHRTKKHHGTAIARVAKAEVNGPTATQEQTLTLTEPVVPAPPSQLTLDIPTEQGKDFWAIWLGAIVLASGGLLWFALRRTSDGRGKNGRRLVFNS